MVGNVGYKNSSVEFLNIRLVLKDTMMKIAHTYEYKVSILHLFVADAAAGTDRAENDAGL